MDQLRPDGPSVPVFESSTDASRLRTCEGCSRPSHRAHRRFDGVPRGGPAQLHFEGVEVPRTASSASPVLPSRTSRLSTCNTGAHAARRRGVPRCSRAKPGLPTTLSRGTFHPFEVKLREPAARNPIKSTMVDAKAGSIPRHDASAARPSSFPNTRKQMGHLAQLIHFL